MSAVVESKEVTAMRKRIRNLREKLSAPEISRDSVTYQTIVDQIDDLKREIENLTRQTRKVVSVSNAPVVADRVNIVKRKRGFASLN